LTEDFTQSVLYDGNGKNAKMVGVEYIISERLYNKLNEEEKLFWHPHAFDVISGTLLAPGLPSFVEKNLMKDLVRTYGKAWMLWQADRGKYNS
jgi:hypothetical protein